jgi:small subunit ribosomal protein S8
MVKDTISDTLTRIRNANMVKHKIVKINLTKISLSIIEILKEEGFIEDFETYNENGIPYLLISLKYSGKLRQPAICKIERISKPGLRVYVRAKKLPKILNNLGIAIISTSKGIMTNFKAKKLGIGGEVLCSIW